jgi:hypothetical protein
VRLALLACALLVAAPAAAEIERFAVLVGTNSGDASEPLLQYAEDDAAKVRDVLVRLGGFRPENVVLLRGADERELRRALLSVNDRVRTSAGKGNEPLLMVFYSGHADAKALHLGGTKMELFELEQLVSGSAADFRLLVVDACRSGAITRVKGGKAKAPFALTVDDRLAGQGFVVLTAAAAGEDAQESDAIKGSFFTHHLVSGLMGAADKDTDGKVVLEEAYRYAYEHTLRSTSRTLAGTQHPTFRYDLRGRGDVTLTRVTRAGTDAQLSLPSGASFLVFKGSMNGPVLAEVGAEDATRNLTLRPGRYFLRGRGKRALLEGELELAAGDALSLDPTSLERTEYARLVRKGHATMPVVHGPLAGYQARGPLFAGDGLCHGVYAAWPVELRYLSLTPRLGACRSGFSNANLSSTTDEVSLAVRGAYAWDLPLVTLEVGGSIGASVFRQHFETIGVAPARSTGAGLLGLGVATVFDLPAGLHARVDLEGRTYLLSTETAGKVDVTSKLVPTVGLGLGKRF